MSIYPQFSSSHASTVQPLASESSCIVLFSSLPASPVNLFRIDFLIKTLLPPVVCAQSLSANPSAKTCMHLESIDYV